MTLIKKLLLVVLYLVIAIQELSGAKFPTIIDRVEMKMDLVDLLTNPDNNLLDQNQNVNELTLF